MKIVVLLYYSSFLGIVKIKQNNADYIHMNPTKKLQENSEGEVTMSSALRIVSIQFKEQT